MHGYIALLDRLEKRKLEVLLTLGNKHQFIQWFHWLGYAVSVVTDPIYSLKQTGFFGINHV